MQYYKEIKAIVLRNLIFCSVASILFAIFFLLTNERNGSFVLAKANAQTGIRAVAFVIGDTCPPGMQDPVSAGLGNWYNRLPFMVNDSSDNVTNPTGTLIGGGAVVSGGTANMTTTHLPNHAHSTSNWIRPNAGGGPGFGGSGGGFYNPTTYGNSTNSAGGGADYYQPFIKLKPCLWQIN